MFFRNFFNLRSPVRGSRPFSAPRSRPSVRFWSERTKIHNTNKFRKIVGTSLVTLGLCSFTAFTYVHASTSKDTKHQIEPSKKENEPPKNSENETTIKGNSENETTIKGNSENETTIEGNSENETTIEGNSENETTIKGNSENEINTEEEEEVHHFNYVILGEGLPAVVAVQELIKRGAKGRILLVSEDSSLQQSDIYKGLDKIDFSNLDFKIFAGDLVESINFVDKLILLSPEKVVKYDKCLVTTGSKRPFNLPQPEDKSHFLTLSGTKYIAEFDAVFQDPNIKHITVIGEDTLGTSFASEIFQKCKETNKEVVQIIPQKLVMQNYFPPSLAGYITQQLIEKDNVKIIAETKPTEIVQKPDQNFTYVVKLDDGQEVVTNQIICLPSPRPSTSYLVRSQLEYDKHNYGIVVNQELLAISDLWVAGEMACYWNPSLGRNRIGYHDSIKSTKLAVQNMLGSRYLFSGSPYSNGKISNNEYSVLGKIDPSLDIVSVWIKGPAPEATRTLLSPTPTSSPGSEVDNYYEQNNMLQNGIVYYLKDKDIKGILLWNVIDRVHEAHSILLVGRPFVDYADFRRFIPLLDEKYDETFPDQTE